MTRPTRIPATVAFAALIALSACEQKAPEVVGGPVPDETSIAAANQAPVALPPSIASSKVYRCKDKSVVYTNFMTDNLTVTVRDKEEDPPRVTLVAPAAGEPFIGTAPLGEGFKLVGNGDEVTYTSPKSGTQVCKA